MTNTYDEYVDKAARLALAKPALPALQQLRRLAALSTVPPPPSDLATKEAPVRRAGQRRGRNRKEVYRMSKSKYQSDVILGDKYRDPLTGFEGVATAATFYLHACERVTLEYVKDGEIKYESFDAPRLIPYYAETQPQTTRTGGPGGREARPNRSADRR